MKPVAAPEDGRTPAWPLQPATTGNFGDRDKLNLKTAVQIDREPRAPRENKSWNASYLTPASFIFRRE